MARKTSIVTTKNKAAKKAVKKPAKKTAKPNSGCKSRRKDYDDYKDRQAAISRDRSSRGRDIGEIPPIVNPERREACRTNLKLFLETYFPETFTLAWSPDHVKVISKLERAIAYGGLFALAMPRGAGKTSMCECGAIFAKLYGYSPCTVLIGSEAGHAERMLQSIKIELENNERLAEDFPEVCYPIEKIEGISNRCNGQTYHGQRTYIKWKNDVIALPVIKASAASGAVLMTSGLLGAVRGIKYKLPDGRSIRPKLVIADDPQTDESARSETQTTSRVDLLSGAVLGLAGPGVKISGVMPCTVIRPNDMADQILDPEKYPEWQGERTKMLYEFPQNMELWQTYREIRNKGLVAGDGGAAGTAYYAQHREEMDRGAAVAWEERKSPDELSALQHAMNLMFRNESAFFSEYQNDPRPDDEEFVNELTEEDIENAMLPRERGFIPAGVETLTAFIDVHDNILYWMLCGWEDDFTGHMIDYGTCPDQGRGVIFGQKTNVGITLDHLFPQAGLEGQIYSGLKNIVKDLSNRQYRRKDGASLLLDAVLIDDGSGLHKPIILNFISEMEPNLKKVVMASKGAWKFWDAEEFSGQAARSREYDFTGNELGFKKKRDEKDPDVMHIIHLSPWWKSVTRDSVKSPRGAKGNFSLFGADRVWEHKTLIKNLTSEFPVPSNNGQLDRWKVKKNRDNHWWDCLVGCFVGAAVTGQVRRSHTEREPKRETSEIASFWQNIKES